MGGQTGTQQQQTQQTTQLPPWVNDAAQKNYAFAEQTAARPLAQYQGQMVADTSPQLQQSWNTAAQAGSAGLPQFNAATSGFLGALSQTPMSIKAGQIGSTNLDPYMNPYTKDVINSSLPIMQQELGKQYGANAGGAVASGAFGGSRFGVQQGVTQAQGALGMGQMAANLNAANFAQAQAAATGDINRTFSADQSNQGAQQAKINSDIAAAAGLNSTGQNAAQQANNAYTMQNSAGASQMGQAQSLINANMAKYNEANNYPTKQLGILQSSLGMTPYGQSTTGQSNTETYTPTDWAALAAAGVGAVGNIFGGKSDMRVKKNIKRVATHRATGMPIYDFHFKGDRDDAPKTRGPMAQDVALVMPEAVAAHPKTGVLHVHPTVLGALAHPSAHARTEHRRRIRPPQVRGALG